MMRPIASLSGDPPQLVSDLINVTSASWKQEKVQECFVKADCDVILGIPLCTRNIPDFWSWNFDKRGMFTVRSAYRMLVDIKTRREAWLEGRASSSDNSADSKSWTKLWKINSLEAS
jgi:hypothetical protein